MSDSTSGAFTQDPPAGGTAGTSGGTVDTVRHEAGEVKDTAVDAAQGVAATGKEEAGAVAQEAKDQVRGLYDQARGQLAAQADEQQQRLANGLGGVGESLRRMADGDDGVAGEIVGRIAQRASAAGSWLGERDPASLVREVTSFARRRPGTFIALAAVAGVVAGRLTRALAAGSTTPKAPTESADALRRSPAPPTAVVTDAPLYSNAVSRAAEVPEDRG